MEVRGQGLVRFHGFRIHAFMVQYFGCSGEGFRIWGLGLRFFGCRIQGSGFCFHF